MREKDIHNLIEQQNPEAKERIWQKISSQIDVASVPRKKTVSNKKIGLWSAIAAALICVVTLSVALPLALNNNGEDNEPKIRYCDITQYVTEIFDQTIKEYSLSHNAKICYVDWYENADEIDTSYGHNKEDKNDIFFITEKIISGETGEEVTLSVTNNVTRVDIFENFIMAPKELTVKDITVKYDISNFTQCSAMFEYKNYMYYMQLDTDGGTERLTEVIESMLKLI